MENLYYFNHGPKRVRNCSAHELTFLSDAQGSNSEPRPFERVSFTDPTTGRAELERQAAYVPVAPQVVNNYQVNMLSFPAETEEYKALMDRFHQIKRDD